MSNYKIKDRQLSEDFVLPVEKGGRVNPNLLHNWYFGNPVNRNGKTEYNKSGWNIDRWYASISTGGSVNLIDDAIQIIGGTNNTSFRQYVDVPIAEAYTCSFLCEITGGMAYMQTFYTDGTAGKYIYTASNGLFSFTDTSQKQINRVQFGVEAGVTLTLYACKLELGDTQTLAHQNEEGNWVLNEIPDFGEQYAICCQYDKTSGEYLGLTPEAIGARPSTWMPSANDVGAPTVEEMNEVKNSVSDGKTKVANAITAKGVTTATDATFATMANNINSITTLSSGTSDATIGAGDVLSGKIGYGKNGAKVTGTMTNNGAVSQTLSANGTYTIPAGYHNGSGKVTQSLTTKGATTYTPKTTNQTIASGTYLTGVQTIKGDANLVAGNIKSGVSIFGVAGSYAPAISDVLGAISSVTERSISKGQKLSFANSPKFIVVEYRYSSNTYGVMLVSIPDLKAMVIRGELSLNQEFTVLTTGGVVQLSEGTEYVFGGNRSGSSSTFCMIRITATTIYASRAGLSIYECA